MKNRDSWKPTKFVIKENHLSVNKDGQYVKPQSWISIDLVAKLYDEYIPRYAKGRLLDLGCGVCPLYELYVNYVESILCVDWNHSFYVNSYIDFSWDITQPLPLQNSSFDTILLSDVLEHISAPEQLIREIYRLLAKNGILLMNVPFLYWIHEMPHDYYRYTEYSLSKILKSQGFEVEGVHVVGGMLESWMDFTGKVISFVPVVGAIVPRILFELTRALRRISLFNKKTQHLDRLFPTGYFIVARKL